MTEEHTANNRTEAERLRMLLLELGWEPISVWITSHYQPISGGAVGCCVTTCQSDPWETLSSGVAEEDKHEFFEFRFQLSEQGEMIVWALSQIFAERPNTVMVNEIPNES